MNGTRPRQDPATTSLLLRCIRYGLPTLIIIAGIVALTLGGATSAVGGASLIGARTW